ncbi:hypothetical protein ABK040_013435 [Willaertia magna]
MEIFFTIETLKLTSYGNHFKVLKQFRNLKNLKAVFLSRKYFYYLKNLQKLEIYSRDCLQYLKQLKKLDISYSNITDHHLKNLINLNELNISSCSEIKGICLQNFTKLEKLVARNIYILNIEDYISNLTFLKELYISSYSLLTRVKYNSSFLKKLINLEKLEIIGDNFKDVDFYNLQNLKYLKIEGTGLIRNCFNYLNKLEKLIFKLKDIKEVNYLNKIKNIKIINAPLNIGEEEIPKLENIVKLDVSCLNHFTGKILPYLINLKTLHIESHSFKDNYLLNLKNLRKLNLNKNKQVNGQSFLNLINLKILLIEEPMRKMNI